MAVHREGEAVSTWSAVRPKAGLVLVIKGGRSRVVHLIASG